MTHEELVQALARGMRPEAWDFETGSNDAQYEAYKLTEDTLEDIELGDNSAYDAYEDGRRHCAESVVDWPSHNPYERT